MKKIFSVILAVSLLLSSLTIAVSAKAAVYPKINEKIARDVATFYLATLEPFSLSVDKMTGAQSMSFEDTAAQNDLVELGSDFTLLEGRELYNIDDETAFYNFSFESTADRNLNGYITVSVNSDLPFVMEQEFSPSPYAGDAIVTTYYISPMVYFNETADGKYLNKDGEAVAFSQIEGSFKDYSDYRTGLYLNNYSFIQVVVKENNQTLSAIKQAKAAGFWADFSFESIKAYIVDLLYYYLGSIMRTANLEKDNANVEKFIKNHAGEGYTLSFSSIVDKDYMVPRRQSYYETNVGNGICGKASSMMALAFYRDGRGFSSLPDDAAMYAQLSEIYENITSCFSFFFEDEFVNDEMGLSESYEMLGTLDMGLAYYLYSKGYRDAAQNVIDNACFSITFVPDAISDVLMTVLKAAMSKWLYDKTNGELTFLTAVTASANDIVINTLKKGEPVVIGSLAAIGCDEYSNHYFPGVGYYKMVYDYKLNNITVYELSKEYVEVYDTWGSHSSIMNWSVFKSTALYSATSLADVQ